MFFTGRGKAKSVRAGRGKGSKSQGWAHTAKGEKKHTAAMMFHDRGCGTPFPRRAGRPFLINMHVPGACIVPHHGQYVPLVPG